MTDNNLIAFPGGEGEKLPASEDLPKPIRGDLATPSARETAFARFMEEHEVKYSYGTEAFSFAGQDLTPYELIDALIERTDLRTIIGGVNDNTLLRLLRLWEMEAAQKEKARVLNDFLPYDFTHVDAVEDWVRLACREGDKGKDYTVVMIRQWIWQVRRALLGMGRYDHIMLVWQGEQGNGKTTSIQNFLKPINPFWSEWDLKQITDERQRAGLSRNYAGYVNELSGSKQADLETLKSVITASNVTYRPMKTNKRMRIAQNCSFIGDTNSSVAAIFKDTENRRFWEVRLKPKNEVPTKYIWNFKRFDEMWGSVDPLNNDSPLSESDLRHQIQAAQTSELGTMTPVHEWLIEEGIAEGPHKIPAADLYDLFKKWANPRQLFTGNSQWFGRQLTDRLPRGRGRIGHYNGAYYQVNTDLTKK